MSRSRGIRQRDPENMQLRRMVDAIRAVLGLDALYCSDPPSRVNTVPTWWNGCDPNGNRLVPCRTKPGAGGIR